jgi:hypothetical protein
LTGLGQIDDERSARAATHILISGPRTAPAGAPASMAFSETTVSRPSVSGRFRPKEKRAALT